jgi:hypothetical protein
VITSPVEFEEYPDHGRMLVVAPTCDRVYWLPDRFSALDRVGDTARVVLAGDSRRMMAAHADQFGHIDLAHAFNYDGLALPPGTLEAGGYAVLTDKTAAFRALCPPFVADTSKRPRAEHLQDPSCSLMFGHAVMVHSRRRALVWVSSDPGSYDDDSYFSFAAPLFDNGSVDWQNAEELRTWPASYRRELWPLAESLSERDREYM